MTGRHALPEGSPEYWRQMHARLAREGRIPAPHTPEQLAAALAPPDMYAGMNTLDAASWLEAIKKAVELVEGTSPYEIEWLAELELLRIEARYVFEHKFFEVRS